MELQHERDRGAITNIHSLSSLSSVLYDAYETYDRLDQGPLLTASCETFIGLLHTVHTFYTFIHYSTFDSSKEIG